MRVLLLCSVKQELPSFILKDNYETLSIGDREFFYLKERTNCLIFAVTGIGKSNAAATAAMGILLFRPDLVLNFGIGGGFRQSKIGLCSIAIATEELYADEGVLTRRGFSDLKAVGISLINRELNYGRFKTEQKYTNRIFNILQKKGLECMKGRFVTVSTITGTEQRASYLFRRFRPICENMEGAAIAHICNVFGVKFVEIRAISNFVGRRQKSKWKTLEATHMLDKVIEVLKQELFTIKRR